MTNESSRKVTALWTGGWDEYLIDPNQVRDLTSEELAEIARSEYLHPEVGGWLHCRFTSRKYGIIGENQVVKILKHLGSGD